MLGRNAVCPQRNVQPKGVFGEGSYGGRGEQIIQRPGNQHRGEYQNRGRQLGSARDPNVMEVNKQREEDRTYFIYRKWGYIAKNCWQRKERERRVVKMLQESAKDNGEQ